MKNILTILLLGAMIFVVSCGPKVELNYEKLETQYVELAPYWDIVFEQKDLIKDKDAAIAFSKYYQEARDIINYYNQSGRDVDASGFHKGAPSNVELLWYLKKSLNSASARTNAIINGRQ